jgi:hypothetical protein
MTCLFWVTHGKSSFVWLKCGLIARFSFMENARVIKIKI